MISFSGNSSSDRLSSPFSHSFRNTGWHDELQNIESGEDESSCSEEEEHDVVDPFQMEIESGAKVSREPKSAFQKRIDCRTVHAQRIVKGVFESPAYRDFLGMVESETNAILVRVKNCVKVMYFSFIIAFFAFFSLLPITYLHTRSLKATR